MSRSLLSATQRVVDKGFRNGAFTPKPAMVLDTRDGVYEAAANGLGVGFIWEFGSSREDRIRKLRVIDFEQGHPEHIFHLAGRASPLIAGFETIQLLAHFRLSERPVSGRPMDVHLTFLAAINLSRSSREGLL